MWQSFLCHVSGFIYGMQLGATLVTYGEAKDLDITTFTSPGDV